MKESIKKRIEAVRRGEVPEGYRRTKDIGIAPSDWRVGQLSDVLYNKQRPVPKPDEPYWRLGVRSWAKGTFHAYVDDPAAVDMDELYVVQENDLVLLVMPQDIQAPKGRLILPQVQTLRELLDKKCLVMSCTTDKLVETLEKLTEPPKLIITDSQVFGYVYEHKPKESMLTSFSVLFAAYKGDLPYYVEGAKHIDTLKEDSRVLIAECCTHAPLQEDIGRVKLPRMLRKRFGPGISIEVVSGTDFPEDLSRYDLIIQCGACMFNRTYVMARVDRAKRQQVPMTNYGVTIAHLTGILDKVVAPS